MCGIAGYMDLLGRNRVEAGLVEAMTRSLVHRGPDSRGTAVEPNIGLGVQRLKIIDLESGDQPIYNEDRSIVLVCNGEIFNYPELRAELIARGHRFRTRTDVEVLVHLYEEEGAEAVRRLNGQFGFALWDRREQRLLLARDHFGINPLYYAVVDGLLLFASEIKAILEHPRAPRGVDLVGLDQILSFPGLVSPRTIFRGIESLKAGHWILAAEGGVSVREYWDLDYPEEDGGPERREEEYVEELRELFARSVRRRLQADVPVGLFVSGGMDSSLVSAVTAQVTPGVVRDSFSVSFANREIDESPFQKLISETLGCRHHEIRIDSESIAARLRAMVFHCECPVKETFNTCTLALAEAARAERIPVVLGGEGADELFGGYPGYRFDAFGQRRNGAELDVDAMLEEELREELWGDRDLFYEKDQIAFREVKTALYSPQVVAQFDEIDCLAHPLVNKERLRNRHALHQRSYLDFKLRLADHLLTEHGDRMVMAHSVEGRYPFLDLEIVDFARRLPPSLKVKDLTEKYIVRRIAEGVVPRPILEREKFGFRAPGSPALLRQDGGWMADLLAEETVRRLGFFNSELVESLKRQHLQEGFDLHPHLHTDLLLVVVTLHLLCEQFGLPGGVS